jgi:hypothetical protein
LNEDIGLTEVIMNDLVTYCEEVKKALKELVKKGKVPNENFGEQIFVGRMNH